MDYIIIVILIILTFVLTCSDKITEKIMNNKIIILSIIIYFVYNKIHFGLFLILLFAYLLYDNELRSEIVDCYYYYKSINGLYEETPVFDLELNEPNESDIVKVNESNIEEVNETERNIEENVERINIQKEIKNI